MSAWGSGLEEWQRQQEAARQAQALQPQPQVTPPKQVSLAGAGQFSGTGPDDPNNPGNPIVTNYNPNLNASDQQAQQLAQKLGGVVVQAPLREAGGGTAGSPFNTPNANYIQMPNGAVVDAGTLLSYQAAHPGDPATANRMIQEEIAGSTPQAMGFTGADNWYQQNIAPDKAPGSAQWQAQGAAMPAFDQKLNGVGTGTGGRVLPPLSTPSAGGTGGVSGPGKNPATGGGRPSATTSLHGAGAGSNPTGPGVGRGRGGLGSGYGLPTTAVPTTDGPPTGGGITPPSGGGTPTTPTFPTPPVSGGGVGVGKTPLRPPTGGGGGGVVPAPPTRPTQPTQPTRPGAPGTGSAPTYSGTPPYTPAATPTSFPNWETGDGTNGAYVGGDPGFMASALQNRSLDYGNQFNNQFGAAYGDAQAQSQAYQGQADSAYDALSQTPGYTSGETSDIMGRDQLNGAQTTDGEFDSNYLSPEEQAAMQGDAGSVGRAFDPNSINSTSTTGTDWTKGQFADSLSAARTAAGGATSAVNEARSSYANAIDPSKLEMSDAEVAGLKSQAGQQIGLQYGAAQDQLTRAAAASGNVNPLSLAASRDRLLRSQSIDSADAVTNADLAARGAQRNAASNVAGMRIGAATSLAGLGQNAAQLATGTEANYGQIGANLGTNASAQNTAAREAAGNTAISQAAYTDQQNAARNAAVAQNRQTTSLANQGARYSQGLNTTNALSTRAQNVGQQRIQGQQAARNYWQGQSQYQGSQANAAGTAQLSGAQTSLAGQGAGANAAVGTEIGRRANPGTATRILLGGL